jgi:hypothetical protein
MNVKDPATGDVHVPPAGPHRARVAQGHAGHDPGRDIHVTASARRGYAVRQPMDTELRHVARPHFKQRPA